VRKALKKEELAQVYFKKKEFYIFFEGKKSLKT